MKVRCALVTSQAHPDLYDDDLPLVAALKELGINARPAIWSDPGVDWDAFDALVIRSPWDYFQDLARAGVPLIPTIFVEQGERPDIAALARARGWDDIVVKPAVSGTAWRTYRFPLAEAPRHAGDIAHTLADRGLLVQPFLPEIQSAGELSLLFFDGVFSHAVCKRPKAGDYRVQNDFGGTAERVDASEHWIRQARACIAAAPALPVYARVDGVIKDGRFLLMELEVLEPVMFLRQHSEAPMRFARAIRSRLAA